MKELLIEFEQKRQIPLLQINLLQQEQKHNFIHMLARKATLAPQTVKEKNTKNQKESQNLP